MTSAVIPHRSPSGMVSNPTKTIKSLSPPLRSVPHADLPKRGRGELVQQLISLRFLQYLRGVSCCLAWQSNHPTGHNRPDQPTIQERVLES